MAKKEEASKIKLPSFFQKLKNPKISGPLVFILALIIFLSVFGVGIYKRGWDDKFTQAVSKIVPYPAVLVDYRPVSYASYLNRLKAIKFYQKQFKSVDYNSQEGKQFLKDLKDQVVNQLVEDKIISWQAKKYKLTVTQEELDKEYSKLAEEAGNEEKMKEVLAKYFDWTVSDFKQELRGQMLKQKVEEKVTADEEINKEAKNKALDLLEKLKKGASFEETAKKYSQDTKASQGGDAGWQDKASINPDIANKAFEIKIGQLSDVIKTVNGFYIIKVVERKENQVHIQQILIKGKSFGDWLKEQKAKVKIKRLI